MMPSSSLKDLFLFPLLGYGTLSGGPWSDGGDVVVRGSSKIARRGLVCSVENQTCPKGGLEGRIAASIRGRGPRASCVSLDRDSCHSSQGGSGVRNRAGGAAWNKRSQFLSGYLRRIATILTWVTSLSDIIETGEGKLCLQKRDAKRDEPCPRDCWEPQFLVPAAGNPTDNRVAPPSPVPGSENCATSLL